MSGTGCVVRKETFRLEPIQERLREIKATRGALARICRDMTISRNHLYLVARGKSDVTEETLHEILSKLGLTWEEVKA